jgi:hypothetical protein
MLVKNGDPNQVDKPSTIILVPKNDGRVLKFKDLKSGSLILSSHQELALKAGPAVKGIDGLFDKEAFMMMSSPDEVSKAEFSDGDVNVNGLTFTIVGGAVKGHLVVLTDLKGSHEFTLHPDGTVTCYDLALGYG